MGIITSITTLLLVGLTTLGYLSTLRFAGDNGTYDKLLASTTLPSTSIPLSPPKTRIPFLDDTYFPAIISFSYSAISGELPQLTLLTFYFYGQATAVWLLMLLESFRVGNAWRLVSFAAIFGLAFENLGMGLSVPLYFLLHTITSPTASAPSKGNGVEPAQFKTSLLVHPTELRVLPWSLAIGLGIPTALSVILPAEPQDAPWKSAQFWMSLRMFHPLLTSAMHLGLSMLHRNTASQTPKFANSDERNRTVSSSLRHVYRIASLASIIPHIAVFTLLTTAYLAPSLFSIDAQSHLTFSELFGPIVFWQDGVRRRPFTLIEGGFWFVQWEVFVSGFAVLVWAFGVNRDALWEREGVLGYFRTVSKSLAMCLVGGPGLAAVELLRERDEVLLEEMGAPKAQGKIEGKS